MNLIRDEVQSTYFIQKSLPFIARECQLIIVKIIYEILICCHCQRQQHSPFLSSFCKLTHVILSTLQYPVLFFSPDKTSRMLNNTKIVALFVRVSFLMTSWHLRPNKLMFLSRDYFMLPAAFWPTRRHYLIHVFITNSNTSVVPTEL